MNSGTAQSSLPVQLQTVDKRRPKVPAVSEKQRRWLYTPSAKKALGAAGAKEWQDSSKGLNLPEKAPSRAGKRIAQKKK
jgi:hypothetical protein